MMIRTSSGGFLDFNGEIEVERQSKLFEALDETWGDYSYTFELPLTQNNITELGIPFPDNVSKLVYQKIDVDLVSESGEILYKGFLRIERITDVIETSFFSGNNNWMSVVSGITLQELNLSRFDKEINATNIQASWTATEGTYFPVIDTGILSTRRKADLVREDFYPFMYMKTVVNQLFVKAGLKLTGDLLNDWRYNRAIITGGVSQDASIITRSSYASLSANQAIAEADGPEPIIFDDIVTAPYFDGSQGNFNPGLGRYTADVPMRLNVIGTASFSSASNVYRIAIRINGSPIFEEATTGEENLTVEKSILLDTGDYVEIYVEVLNTLGTANVTAATFKITPTFLYKTIGGEFLPRWTGAKLMSNIFSMFNCIVTFDSNSRTVTANLFEKIKSKPAIDISQYISGSPEIDYSDFIGSYGKKTRLIYQEYDFSEQYNSLNEVPYGAKSIEVNNDFIDEESDAVELDFVASFQYENPGISTPVEQFDFFELDEGDQEDISSITDNSGQARVNVGSSQPFTAGDIVRIETEQSEYNGDWIIETIGVGWIEPKGMAYSVSSTGTATVMLPKVTGTDDAYILLAVPNRAVSDISNASEITLALTPLGTIGYAYFNLLDRGMAINGLTQSLSFGPVNDPLHYQQDLYTGYFRQFNAILNDPVMLKHIAHFPEHVFKELSVQTPIQIKSIDTTNFYYLNQTTGYKGSSWPCEIKLIKLP